MLQCIFSGTALLTGIDIKVLISLPLPLLPHRAVTVTSLEVPSPTGSSTSPPTSRRMMRAGNSEGSVWTRLATNTGENPGDMRWAMLLGVYSSHCNSILSVASG